MTAKIIPMPPPANAARFRAIAGDVTVDQMQRAWLAVEEAIAGEWSEACLIALLADHTPAEREAILAELEARPPRKPRAC